MFDIGFSELLVIGVVALLVIGPEKLPRVARTVGALMGRAQRYVNDVKADIHREIELDELKKLRTSVTEAAQSIESSVKETVSGFEAQAAELNNLASGSTVPPTDAPATPSAESLAAADETIRQALAATEMPVPEAIPVYAPVSEAEPVAVASHEVAVAPASSPEAVPTPGAKA
jgi:sec-independent protein translocase protein TatB